MKLGNMRPGNKRAFDVILKRLRAGEPTTSIVKPTRYGKRDLIITSCLQAVEDSIVSGGLVFSPASQATRQFFKESKLKETIRRYEMSGEDILNGIRQLKSFNEYQPFSNGEFLLAVNQQLCLRTNIDDCLELIDAEHHRTGQPMVFYIDECQMIAEKKRWADFFRRVQDKGVLLVLLTATPYREDADAISGFRSTVVDTNDQRRYLAYDAGDGIHNRIDVWDGIQTLSVLEPDDITTFREAWDEVPTVLCKLDREIVGLPIDDTQLRNLSPKETLRHIGKVVRDERFLEPAIRILLGKLKLVQTIDPRTKGMVMTGNDQPNDRRDNAHAETIKRIMIELAPTILGRSIKVKIVTLKTLEDESAAQSMDDFLEGDYDFVIVKQVGTVGLDDWRIKVLGYFSPIRSVAAMIQAWMRPATPEGGLKIAHLVMPEDRFCTAVWEKLIVEEGGEAKLSEMSGWAAEKFVETYLKPKEDEPDHPDLPFGPGNVSGFDDSRGNVGGMPYYDAATALFEQLPQLSGVCTKAEIAKALERSGQPATGSPQRGQWSIERKLEVLYKDIVDLAEDKTRRLMKIRTGGIYDQAVYAKVITKIFGKVYRLAEVPREVETLRQIKNAATLLRIKQIMGNLSDDEFRSD
jgi:hypothetical protein